MPRPRRRALFLAAASLLLTSFPVGMLSVAHAGEDRAGDPSLPHAAHGQEAIRLLGNQLDEAAALNGLTPAKLREVLGSDPSAWVDVNGRVYYVEPVAEPADGSVGSPQEAAPFPLGQTFLLHSRPTSTHKIFLDFDGTTVSGTAWNASGLPNGFWSGFTLDGDPATFTDAEKEEIQKVWQRVAEDYATFDVDVTTDDPGAAAIQRTNLADQDFGTRVLITDNSTASAAVCNNACGGVAYLGVFDETGATHDYYQPAWVMAHLLGNNTKNIGEATSHEVGHNFGLNHDGRNSPAEGYYYGHDMWAPIMGVGYNRPVVQWSKGEYTSANNAENDVNIIAAGGAPVVADEAGSTVGTAAPGLLNTAYITSAADTDTFTLGACSGAVTVTATGAPPSQNLDILLEVLDSGGATVASDNPAAAFVSSDSATGLNAAVATNLAAGNYFARVDGVGVLTAATGYTDYGSIGAYTLVVTGCNGLSVPSAPTSLQVVADPSGTFADVTWAAPASNGGSAVTAYTVSRSGAASSDQAGTSKHWAGLTPGQTYLFSVSAKNAIGSGPAAAVSVRVAGPPDAPTDLQITPAANGQSATVTWSPPLENGGNPITGYTLTRTGAAPVDLGVVGTHTWTGLTPGAPYTFTVAAKNVLGTGTAASQLVTMPTIPWAPENLVIVAADNGQSATVTWSPPGSDGGSAITGYTLTRTGGSPVNLGVVGTHTWTGLTLGATYDFTVSATNGVGPGPQVSGSASMPATPSAPAITKAKSGTPGGKRTASVTWTAPTSTGGRALTGYQVLVFKKGGPLFKTFSVPAGTTTYRATLKGGKYKFAIVALNAAGAGPQSALSKKVTAQ